MNWNSNLYIVFIQAFCSNYEGQRLNRIPYFIKTPKNETYREGSSVELYCEAAGICF